MKVLFDTNVVLDVLLRRQPFHQDAAKLFAYVELREIEGYLGATTVTTLYYFMEKTLGDDARTELRRLFELFKVATVDKAVLDKAVTSPLTDYEDAVLVEAAFMSNLDAIVTRNIKDFKNTSLRVLAPEELLAMLTA